MTAFAAVGYGIPVRGGGSLRPSGFTLVESVVALAVLSLLMVTVLAALRAFGNTQESLERVTGRADELRAVSSFLRESLEATVVSPHGGGLTFGGSLAGGGRELPYFRGDQNGFEWKARLVFGESYGGTFLVRVARDDEQRLQFWWQRPPESMEGLSWEGQMSRVLIPDLQEVQLAYRDDESEEWLSSWEETDSPALVRMIIKSKDRYWPELLMAVQR